MENDPIPLPSGATLELHIASFKDSSKLKRVVADELTKVKLDSINLTDFAAQDVGALKNVVFGLLASEALERAVFDCAKMCTIDGEKITMDSFESKETRGDYMIVAWEVMRLNLLPFVEHLLSKLKQSFPAKENPQKLV